ncbi:MAG: hypothetical protein F9K24_14185 [Leptonema illini]|uniref:Flagellar filament outer layer protein FlaA n=2 Tax=Leptonema illini TaxID=183 RepID=H2CIG5_9LEPT|nr:flagellar filament outer layer protein FlaA [Leptonema illini]EHQ05958.1 flagellar filament outer layer protein FlaA [Leptonema illini DSM 21528]KAB2931385.1 MAG: hypothetical protein F9K24_14185 [Leptonema illini]
MRLVLALLLGIAATSLSARSYPPAYDAPASVRAWQELAKDDRYRILTVEPFEDRPYRPYAPSTELADIRYLYDSSDEEAFRFESMLTGQERESRRSLLVMTSFTVPGRQIFQFKPIEPIRIEGQPYRLAVWVRSQEYLHRLEFLFRNADGRLIRVDAGRLYWKGWRRLDLTLPAELHRMGRRITHRTGAAFEGIVIYSHPKSDPGAISLQFDSLLILSDFSGLRYPGGEVVDEW